LAYDYIVDSGIVVADTSTTLTEVQDEFKAIFGDDLDLTPSSPAGLLISQETLTRDGVARFAAQLANQINPNVAGGIFLDAICSLTGLSRTQATKTTVTAILTGDNGTVIPAGTRAQTTNADVFESVTTVTITTGSSVTVQFQALEYGAVPCDIGALTKILDDVLGLNSIVNDVAGTLGAVSQSDINLRKLRNSTLSIYGTGTVESISSALYATLNVQSLKGRENKAATTETIDGIVMLPHSIYFCVNGGTDADVAQAIYDNRSAGSAFNGGTSVVVTSSSGQDITVLFDRPSEIILLARITVRIAPSSSATTSQIQQAVYDYASANFAVGVNVSPYELIGAASQILGVYVTLSEIAPASTGVYQTTEIAIAIDEIATMQLSAINVVVS